MEYSHFFVLMGFSLLAYHRQASWLRFIPYALLRFGRGKTFLIQWMIYSPIFVSWLLLCHWLDVKEWHGLAAAGMGFAMLLGLQGMRQWEEKQKRGHKGKSEP